AHCDLLFHSPPTPTIYTLSLHDALPIYRIGQGRQLDHHPFCQRKRDDTADNCDSQREQRAPVAIPERLHDQIHKRLDHIAEELRSEEHTSELQSLAYLVCRLLLEKKKKI